jgi:hypothetical protein
MPLSVEIKINDRPIETIHIARMEPLKGQTRAHEYKVWVENGPPEDDAIFMHYYDEGARVCVTHALEALHRQRQKRQQ